MMDREAKHMFNLDHSLEDIKKYFNFDDEKMEELFPESKW